VAQALAAWLGTHVPVSHLPYIRRFGLRGRVARKELAWTDRCAYPWPRPPRPMAHARVRPTSLS